MQCHGTGEPGLSFDKPKSQIKKKPKALDFGLLLEIPWRISAEPKICMKSTKNGHSPFSVDFKEMTQESRFEGGHRPKIEIQGSSCRNICRRRDPKCYFDLIPKRKIKNQWKKLETKIPHGVFHWNTPWITGYFSFDFILLKIPIKLIMCFNYFSPLLGINISVTALAGGIYIFKSMPLHWLGAFKCLNQKWWNDVTYLLTYRQTDGHSLL